MSTMNSQFNILVADDELSLRSIISEVLSDVGYNVELAENGKEALERVKQGGIHVVMTDIRMPEMTGIELLEAVKAFNEEIQVIIMTSYASIETAVKAIRLGAYDYLTKPFEDLNIIPTVVDRTVEKMRLELEVKELVSKLKERNEEIESLYKHTTTLFKSLKLEEIIHLSVQAIAQMAHADNVVYYAHNKIEGHLIARFSDKDGAFSRENPPHPGIEYKDGDGFQSLLDDDEKMKKILFDTTPANHVLLPLVVAERFVGCYLAIHESDAEAFPNNLRRTVEQYIRNVSVQSEKAALHEKVQAMAVKDGLTGLYNHRYFQNAIANEIERCSRSQSTFSIILFDIDHFKSYNDINGHPMGDQLLKQISHLVASTSRSTDIVARYGGEEFVIILTETNKEGSAIRAENLRKAVEEFAFANQQAQPNGNVTISGGFAEFPTDGATREALIQAADQALYRAKEGGRNRLLPADQVGAKASAQSG